MGNCIKNAELSGQRVNNKSVPIERHSLNPRHKQRSTNSIFPTSKLPVELGTLQYHNLTEPAQHGSLELAEEAMKRNQERPVLVVFAEWPGCTGSKDGGRIFMDKDIVKAVNEDKLFTAVAFNTWDRHKDYHQEAFLKWAGKERGSDWGHLKLVNPKTGKVVAGTGRIYGFQHLAEVKKEMAKALKKQSLPVPDYLA